VQPLQHVEVVGPLRPELGLEFLVGEDALGESEFGQGVAHRQRVHDKFFQGYFLRFSFLRRWVSQCPEFQRCLGEPASPFNAV
jgi:hypothetical protein